MAYHFHEGMLEIPDDWRDESMNIFKTPVEAGYNLVISRERIPKSIDPLRHLEAQRKVIEENLIGFREHARRAFDLDGQAGVWLEYSWQAPQGAMYQVNLMRVVGPRLVSFTFTCARPFSDPERDLFAKMLTSYRAPVREEA